MRCWHAIFVLGTSLTLAFGQDSNNNALEKYKRDLLANPHNSLTHFRLGEVYFLAGNAQTAANEFRSALNGDLEPKWIEVWSHINLGKLYDFNHQCDRAVNEYQHAAQANEDERGALEEANQYLYANSIRAFTPHPQTDADQRPVRNAPPTTNVILPRPIPETTPEYSDEARVAGIEGTVLVAGVVTKDGSTRDLRVARGLGLGLDEKAIETVRQWQFTAIADLNLSAEVFSSWEIDFRLPSRASRWHLMRANFHLPEGVSRPVFSMIKYPPGAGIGDEANEEGWVLSGMGRFGAAKVSFDIDEQGNSGNFLVENTSEKVWGVEAIHWIRGWRFRPGMKDRVPVTVRCTVEVAWGRGPLSAGVQSRLETALNEPAPPVTPGVCRSVQPAMIVIHADSTSYTAEALNAKRQGRVVVSLVVDENGVPGNLHLVEPLGFGLHEKAIDLVSKFHFTPTMLRGRLQPTPFRALVTFQLPASVLGRAQQD